MWHIEPFFYAMAARMRSTPSSTVHCSVGTVISETSGYS